MSDLVRLQGVRLAYGERTILSDVNLSIEAGSFWFIAGPNGAGKSTLLKAVLGSLAPVQGRIVLGAELAGRSRIGFVPQRCDLLPSVPTTVREFVGLGWTGLGLCAAERRDRLALACRQAGLDDLLPRSYWALSGGQRQRALIARALVRQPRLVVVDEPTSGLDLAAEHALLSLLARLNQDQGLSILFVAHDLRLAFSHGSHVALVAAGRVRCGRAEEVLSGDALSQAYGVPVAVIQGQGGAYVRVGA